MSYEGRNYPNSQRKHNISFTVLRLHTKFSDDGSRSNGIEFMSQQVSTPRDVNSSIMEPAGFMVPGGKSDVDCLVVGQMWIDMQQIVHRRHPNTWKWNSNATLRALMQVRARVVLLGGSHIPGCVTMRSCLCEESSMRRELPTALIFARKC